MSKEIKEEHKIACVYCRTTHDLVMVPHRKGDYIVGWLFVCITHFDKIKSKKLIVEVK